MYVCMYICIYTYIDIYTYVYISLYIYRERDPNSVEPVDMQDLSTNNY